MISYFIMIKRKRVTASKLILRNERESCDMDGHLIRGSKE